LLDEDLDGVIVFLSFEDEYSFIDK
jgi:hypothetical protein